MAFETKNIILIWKTIDDCEKDSLNEGNKSQQVTIKFKQLGCLFPKSVLEKYSDSLKEILNSVNEIHPVLVFNDIPFKTLNYILTFLLSGKVEFSPVEIPLFREWAERLKLRGFYSPHVQSGVPKLLYFISKK